MFTSITARATAFSLSAVFTVAILASINVLATQPAEPGVMAADRTASQVAYGKVLAAARS